MYIGQNYSLIYYYLSFLEVSDCKANICDCFQYTVPNLFFLLHSKFLSIDPFQRGPFSCMVFDCSLIAYNHAHLILNNDQLINLKTVYIVYDSGADPGFQVRGGALKKIAPSGGRRENFWGISCEKSRFYAKKNIFFPILGGARAGCAPPPGSAPVTV